MCINAVTRLLEDLLPTYQYINRYYDFKEYFVPDCDHPSYYWNIHNFNSLGYSLLAALTNDTCIKYFMLPQAYKVVNTHDHEIYVWNFYPDLSMCGPITSFKYLG